MHGTRSVTAVPMLAMPVRKSSVDKSSLHNKSHVPVGKSHVPSVVAAVPVDKSPVPVDKSPVPVEKTPDHPYQVHSLRMHCTPYGWCVS